MRTLIWKELREHVRWLPVGLIVIAAVCYLAAPGRNTDPLLAARLVTQLAIVTPLLAFALGIVQAYRDLQPSGNAYLNHRSVTAHEVFMAKVIAGFALYATAVVIPLLLLAAWIAMQGMHWVPMRPAQVIPALIFALASFTLHPAAMLMLARDASWWGTRVFPLIPTAVALLPLFAWLRLGGIRGAAWGLLAASLLLIWIIWIARQGWRQFSSDPPASLNHHALHRRWLLSANLVVASLSVVIAAVVTTLSIVETINQPWAYEPQPYIDLAVDAATGNPWMMTLVQNYDQRSSRYTVNVVGGDEIVDGKTVNPLQVDDLPESTRKFVSLKQAPGSLTSPLPLGSYHNSDGFFSGLISLSGNDFRYSYDERGFVLAYILFPQMQWHSTIAADGVRSPGDWTGRPFSANPLRLSWDVFSTIYEAGYEPPLVDSNGVYVLDHATAAISKLIDHQIDAIAFIEEEEGQPPTFLIRSGDQLLEYALLDGTSSGAWLQQDNRPVSADRSQGRSLADLSLTARLVNTTDLPAESLSFGNLRVARSPGGWYVVPENTRTPIFHLSSPAQLDSISFRIQPGTSNQSKEDRLEPATIISGMLPGIVMVCGAAIFAWASLTRPAGQSLAEYFVQNPVNATAFITAFLLVTLVSLWLTRRVAVQRGLSNFQVYAWYGSAVVLGLAAPLSVVAIYRRVVREPCPKCQQPRRVDEDRCEHCGAQWEPPQSEGIELIDTHRLPQQAAGVPA